MIACTYRMISTTCLAGLRPGRFSLIHINVYISALQTNVHILNLDRHIIIKEVPSANYLGITIDSKLT